MSDEVLDAVENALNHLSRASSWLAVAETEAGYLSTARHALDISEEYPLTTKLSDLCIEARELRAKLRKLANKES